MKGYQPIGKIKNGAWTNFDVDYFSNFIEAKKWIEKNIINLKKEYNLNQIGLDVHDFKIDNCLQMFWEYKNLNWERNYKD